MGSPSQWKKNGTAIAGATAASYTAPMLAAGDDQSLYTVTVTNAGGSVTSSNATLTVTTTTPPPTGGGGGDDDPLQPLSGPAEPFPQTPAPMAATPTIAGVSPDHRHLLTWDPSSNGMFSLGFLHYSGAETRLYVPVNAFLDDVSITTADVTSIGTAVTSVVAALDIEPTDLVTEKTLTANFMIPDAMAATIDPAQLIGFAADADGSNLHLVPIVVGTFGASITRPAIKLDRLGIVGIAVATPEQQAALATAWPTYPEDRLIAALAPALTAQWRATVAPASGIVSKVTRIHKGIAAVPDDNPAIPIVRGYYNDVVVPAFAAADADPSAALSAINAGFSFLRMAELSGQAGADGAFYIVAQQVRARIEALFDIDADYVAEQCRTLGGPVQRQKMMSAMRRLQLQGHREKSDELLGILPQCSSYKIAFRYEYTRASTFTLDYQAGDHIGIETRADQAHVVVQGTHTSHTGEDPTDGTLQLATLDWSETQTRDNGQVSTPTWAKEDVTPPWRINGVSLPVVRTKGGTPPASVTMYLSPFHDVGNNSDATYHPFTAIVSSRYTLSNGQTGQLPDAANSTLILPIFVPALLSDGQHNFGAMLIPASGSGSSSGSRVTPLRGGQLNESETVTVTISRPD